MNFMPSLMTPQKEESANKSQLSYFHSLSKYSFKEFSPFEVSVCKSPMEVQLQMLCSPPAVKRDLFSELLCTEEKEGAWSRVLSAASGGRAGDQMEWEQQRQEEREGEGEEGEAEEEGQETSSYEEQEYDEADVRKRKRKSSQQINMLRQEMDGEMNWTKEKICRMAEVTGLSQSQVYKWCWDQKKKTAKHKTHAKDRLTLRRKAFHLPKDLPFDATKLKKLSFPRSQQDSFDATLRKINIKLVFTEF